MNYKITFLKQALKEWNKLSLPVREQLYKKLQEVRSNPRIPKGKLSGMQDCYKIKLMSSSYRLVYRVIDKRLVVQVVAIGKRDKEEAYELAKRRLH
jgi:mRNA interferase RelE/StbE